MKKSILFNALLFTSLLLNAQQKCAFNSILNYYEQIQPGYISTVSNTFDEVKNNATLRADEDSFFTVQVVVHVVYKTAAQNLPDSVIHNQIKILNDDYSRKNADTLNLRPEFFPVKGNDSKIRFALATIDPQGNVTNGIVRKSTTTTSFFSLNGGGVAEGVKSAATGGSNAWNQGKYLNIWVCNMDLFGQAFVLGYATPPSGLPNWDSASTSGISDGVVIQYQYFGSNNANVAAAGYTVKGRTVTHEVGHYLGLRHIWGDGGGSGACDGTDGIDDTPKADAASSQELACGNVVNSCTEPTLTFGDLNDMTENYMDYSAETCQNSFTDGQAKFMHNVIVTKRRGAVKNTTNIYKIENNILNIYPNPAINLITLQFSNNTNNAVVSIYNLLGNLVKSEKLNGTHQSIDIAELPNGYYVVNITDNNKNTSQKKLCIKR